MMANYSPQIKHNDQPLCRFAVIHIHFQQLFAKGKVRVRHLCSQSDKPASRAVNFFLLALQAMLASVGLANNVDAYRFGTLENDRYGKRYRNGGNFKCLITKNSLSIGTTCTERD